MIYLLQWIISLVKRTLFLNVSLCHPGCLGTLCVDLANFELAVGLLPAGCWDYRCVPLKSGKYIPTFFPKEKYFISISSSKMSAKGGV